MFHWTDNLFFGRRADGSVRILKFTNPPASFPQADAPLYQKAELDKIIPSKEWVSIVSSVSNCGEAFNYDLAKALHEGDEHLGFVEVGKYR